MEGFLHIFHKNNFQNLNEDNYKNLINGYKGVTHSFKIKQKNNIVGIYYTNEYSSYPYQEYKNDLFCPIGQFIDDKNNLQTTLIDSNEAQKISTVKKLSGAFSISQIDFNMSLIYVFTHVVRAESVYIFENQNKIVVGSDPLLVSVFSNDNHKPEFDSSKFISFFEQGYFADDSSPYKNVFCLPENSSIKIGQTLDIRQIDNTYETAFTYNKSDDLLNEISNYFINAFQIMPDKNAPIMTGLTGGKDSRVILLALLANDYNINTHTTGFKDHPDVIVAKLLAEKLNVPHKINDRKLNKDNQLTIDLENRLLNITKASSGLLSAYDNVTTKTQFNNQNNFNGVAASVITGGFNKFNHRTQDPIELALKKAVYKFDDFYIDKNNYFSTYLEQFAQRSDDYRTLLHLFFLINRTGRWTSDSRIPKSYATNSFSVFLDNQLTKSAMKLNMNDLRSEIIHYKLIEKLNSDLLNIPFANQRFEFEKNGPVSLEDYENWLARSPIFALSKVGIYNWRSLGNNDTELVNAFKEIILSSPNSIVFDNLNYQKVEALLNSKLQSRTNKFLWAIASMIKYTDYMKNLNSSSNNKIKLDTPKDSLTEVKVPSEIIDLTSEYSALNDSIEYDNNSHEISLIPNKKNPYLKTYNAGFNTLPSSVEISSVKEIVFETSLTPDKNYKNLSFYIIFYTSDKRLKSLTIEPSIESNQYVSFKQKVTVPKAAKFFRTAVHFKDKLDSKHKLNYSYAKLIY